MDFQTSFAIRFTKANKALTRSIYTLCDSTPAPPKIHHTPPKILFITVTAHLHPYT